MKTFYVISRGTYNTRESVYDRHFVNFRFDITQHFVLYDVASFSDAYQFATISDAIKSIKAYRMKGAKILKITYQIEETTPYILILEDIPGNEELGLKPIQTGDIREVVREDKMGFWISHDQCIGRNQCQQVD